jgi:flagellar basal body-associated protein FliL
MSAIIDIALGTASSAVKKAILPWLILAATLALGTAGAAGMYAGFEISNARHARDREALQAAQLEAMTISKDALKVAIANGNQVSGEFLAALKGIQIVNTTITNEVRKETEKLIYTDCKLPDSGADLLKRNRDSVNLRLLGKGKNK